MKKAIITGSTGLIGKCLAKYLIGQGIEVLCLGRKILDSAECTIYFGEGASYLRLPMDEITTLDEQLKKINWSPGPACVFFNFAWHGNHKLTDGDLETQLKNVVYATDALRISKKINCIKFINSGTLEESYLEQFLNSTSKKSYQSSQKNYALAKLASRDMCRMLAYLEKIDYVHTRLSIPLSIDLSGGNYVASNLKRIIEGKPIELPVSNQLFDIVITTDVARAYYLIGLYGKNKSDYFIGTSNPNTLQKYFQKFASIVKGDKYEEHENNAAQTNIIFDTKQLYKDTGFIAKIQLHEIIENIQI